MSIERPEFGWRECVFIAVLGPLVLVADAVRLLRRCLR